MKTSSPVINGRFADEDDLFVEVDAANSKNSNAEDLGSADPLGNVQKRQNISDEEEDAGVCLASVSSSSPASSRELSGRRCRSVCVGDIPSFQCENTSKESAVPLTLTNSSAPVAVSTPEGNRKANSGSSSCLMNSNDCNSRYDKNSGNNVKEFNRRNEGIRQPRPASCTFGANGASHSPLEGRNNCLNTKRIFT